MKAIKIITVSVILILSFISVKAQKINEVNHVHMDTLKWEKITDKIERKYVYGSQGMMAYFNMQKDAFIPEHKHPNEQITHILEGKVEVTIGDKKYIVTQGEVLIIPPNIPHSFRALEATIDLDFFTPLRMDWLNNTDKYFNNTKKQ